MSNKYKTELTHRNVLTIRFDGVKTGWEQWVLLRSDAHNDNIHCRRDLEHQHLAKAKERDALIVDAGDLFCAMQGKYDPRSNMDDIRPEDVGANYLDRIVEHAAEQYEPYAKLFLLIAKGNHETNILNRHGTDLTGNLRHRLNGMGGHVHGGFYGGWIRFMFTVQKTKGYTYNMKYYHGKSTSSNAPVTRGVIDTARQAVYLPDAHIVQNGHNHQAYSVPIKRDRLTHMGAPTSDIVWFVRTPGYKDEWNDGAEGYAVEKGMGPASHGCAWVRFFYTYDTSKPIDFEITMDLK